MTFDSDLVLKIASLLEFLCQLNATETAVAAPVSEIIRKIRIISQNPITTRRMNLESI